MKCFEFCVMLNKFGVCESTMRRPERIKECPHKKMGGAKIMSSKSSFDYGWFWDCMGYNILCVNSNKYSKEQAIVIFEQENYDKKVIEIKQGYVRYGYGINDDREKNNGWWLEEENGRNRCPVWCLR